MNKLIYVWFALKTTLCSCQSDRRMNDFKNSGGQYEVTRVGSLPSVANESSGLAKTSKSNSFWTHNDSGGNPELIQIDSVGNLLAVKNIKGAENRDWEDLAYDNEGTVFIGDFGNNANQRKDLTIYRVAPDDSIPEKITFRYADQTEFPPVADKLNFDCEAFFYYKNNLYLFSKNRSKTNRYVKLYPASARPGDYVISATDSIQIKTQVTSADVSPDGKTFVLLTYGKVLVFGIEHDEINFKQPLSCFKIAGKQMEAIVFLNNKDMLITNEQGDVIRVTHR